MAYVTQGYTANTKFDFYTANVRETLSVVDVIANMREIILKLQSEVTLLREQNRAINDVLQDMRIIRSDGYELRLPDTPR